MPKTTSSAPAAPASTRPQAALSTVPSVTPRSRAASRRRVLCASESSVSTQSLCTASGRERETPAKASGVGAATSPRVADQ